MLRPSARRAVCAVLVAWTANYRASANFREGGVSTTCSPDNIHESSVQSCQAALHKYSEVFADINRNRANESMSAASYRNFRHLVDQRLKDVAATLILLESSDPPP
jgi:hypothetical protein